MAIAREKIEEQGLQESKSLHYERIRSEIPHEKDMFFCASQINSIQKGTFDEQELTILKGRGCCVGILLLISECHKYPQLGNNPKILSGYQKLCDYLKILKVLQDHQKISEYTKIINDPDIISFIKAIIQFHKQHLSLVGPLVGLGRFDAAGYQAMCNEMEEGDSITFGTEYYDKRDETHAIGVMRLNKDEYLLIDSSNEEENKVEYCQSKNGNIGVWIKDSLQKKHSEMTCIHYKPKKSDLLAVEVSDKAKKIMQNAVFADVSRWEMQKLAIVRICKTLNVPREIKNIFLSSVRLQGDAKEIKLESDSQWRESIESMKKLIENILERYTKSKEKIKLLKKCDEILQCSEKIFLLDPNNHLVKKYALKETLILIGKVCFQKRKWDLKPESTLGNQFFNFLKQNIHLKTIISYSLDDYKQLAGLMVGIEGGYTSFYSKDNYTKFKAYANKIEQLADLVLGEEAFLKMEIESIKHPEKSVEEFKSDNQKKPVR